MLQGEVHEAEVGTLEEQAGGGDGGAVGLAARGEALFEGGVAAAFEQPPHCLFAAYLCKGLGHQSFLRRLLRFTFSSSMARSPATGTLCCCMLSRSRTVTQPSLSESWSTVMQKGVPIASWRR